ncbi:MAG: phosphatidylserine decarboxylase family protein [candidate division Zixibacteria bacterium]|nr:phosphatidylserine decarboxylase family protein [candidate division Zixibacteria bacterium]
MIARDGLGLIFIGLAGTVGLALLSTWWDSRIVAVLAALVALLTVFTVFFFRDPERHFDDQPGILIAPADGRILGVEKIGHHDFIGGDAVKVSIFMSILDVHVNRIPSDGSVEYIKYRPGKFFKAFLDKASEENEHTEIGITTLSGHRLVVKQIAGIIARRIVCHLKQGDTVEAGARFGMIRFGSRGELIVSADSDIHVTTGDHVKGGATVIGLLPSAVDKAGSYDSTQAKNVEL